MNVPRNGTRHVAFGRLFDYQSRSLHDKHLPARRNTRLGEARILSNEVDIPLDYHPGTSQRHQHWGGGGRGGRHVLTNI